ncbi:hypothetical protein D3C78_1345320 [compost metagenome]
MEVPTQSQWQVDRQYLVLHHGAQGYQPDATHHDDPHAPQHPAFLRRRLTPCLPGGEQIHDLTEERKQPGFVDRHAGTEQRKRKNIATGAACAGPQEPSQTLGWWRYLVRRKGVELPLKCTKHGGLQNDQIQQILPSNWCFEGFAKLRYGLLLPRSLPIQRPGVQARQIWSNQYLETFLARLYA